MEEHPPPSKHWDEIQAQLKELIRQDLGEEKFFRLLELLFNLAPFAVLVIDGSQSIRSVNAYFTERIGWKQEDLVDVNTAIEKMFPDEQYRQYVRRQWEKRFARPEEQQRSSYTYRVQSSEGRAKDLTFYALSIENPKCQILFIEDITEVRADKRKLQTEERKYRAVYHDSYDSIFLLRGEEIVDCNDSLVKLFGFDSQADIIGMHPADLSPSLQPDGTSSVKKAQEMIKTALSGGAHRFPWVHMKKSGQPFYVEVGLTRIRHEGDNLVLAVVRDETDKMKAKEELSRERDLFSAIAESSPIGIILLSGTGTINFANKRAEEILMLEKNELQSRQYNHPEWNITDFDGNPFPAEKLPFSCAKNKGKMVTGIEHAINLPDGTRRYLSINAMPLRNKLHEVYAVITTIEDVTQSIETAAELRKSEEKYHILFDNMINGFAVHDAVTDEKGKPVDYIFRTINPAFVQLTGLSPETVLNKRVTEALPGIEQEWITKMCNIAITGEPMVYEHYLSPLDRHYLVYGYRPAPGQFATIFIETTEQKELIQELQRERDKAEQATEAKTSLLLNLSHEFRTPLTGILGFSSIIKTAEKIESAREYGDRIYRSGKRLLSTLGNIVEFSSMTSGKYEPSITEFTCRDLLNEVEMQFRKTAEEKGLRLIGFCPTGRKKMKADTHLIEESMRSIVDNALKFTFEGEVTINFKLTEANGRDTLLIKIADTGMGIPKDKLDLIFEEFRQVSEGMGRSHEGSGLGLALARRKVELLGGSISVESEVEQGSEFTISVPVEIVGKPEPVPSETQQAGRDASMAETPQEKLRLLLVEDNEIIFEYVQLILPEEYSLDFATTGEAALKLAHEKVYDLALMDINLKSNPDGVETMRLMKELPGGKQTRFVAATGYALQKDEQRFLNAGFDHYLPKPFNTQELLSTISTALKQKG